MQPDYLSLFDGAPGVLRQLLPLAIFAIVVGVSFKWLESRFAPKRRRRWKGQSRWQQDRRKWFPNYDELPPKVPDAADQLRTVMRADFKAQRLLNQSEARLFRETDKIVLEMRPGWQVMAQVSLGEILRCKDAEDYRCINSKRVDLLIVDDECRAVGAIEYQGGGHHQGTAAARDAVKKEAFRRAGIGYEEIVGGHHTPAELRRLIERLLKRRPPS